MEYLVKAFIKSVYHYCLDRYPDAALLILKHHCWAVFATAALPLVADAGAASAGGAGGDAKRSDKTAEQLMEQIPLMRILIEELRGNRQYLNACQCRNLDMYACLDRPRLMRS